MYLPSNYWTFQLHIHILHKLRRCRTSCSSPRYALPCFWAFTRGVDSSKMPFALCFESIGQSDLDTWRQRSPLSSISCSFDIFHILHLSKLQYNHLCTCLSINGCDREATLHQNKKQWNRIFIYRLKTKNGLAIKEDEE